MKFAASDDRTHILATQLTLGITVAGVGLGVVDYDADTIVLDDRAAELFDLPADKPVAREELHSRIHPDDQLLIADQVSCLLAPDGDDFIDVEHRIIHRNGEVLWVNARKQVFFNSSSKPVSGLVALIDVTPHKLAEQRIQFLMDELNHRTKNLMGVVQSIARTSADSEGAREFAKRFSERLNALAFNQDMLVKNQWDHVELVGLVEHHLSPFLSGSTQRISINGPALKLKPDAAQGIGLALHELATNAMKYGALSTNNGSVHVEWSMSAPPEQGFKMSWLERGGPEVDAPERIGFGQKVMREMVAASVRGTVELDYDTCGVGWHLAAPVDAVVQGMK